MPWYAIQYKPGQGDRALENLQNQGAVCFFPKISVEKIQRGKRTTKLEPLFSGYLFVSIEQADPLWSKLRSTRGVTRVVGFANKPAVIDELVIEYIRQSVQTLSEQGGLRQGQKVQLQNGPFKGLEAVFENFEGEERACILITFMQQQQRIKVPLSTLKIAFKAGKGMPGFSNPPE